MLCPSDACHGLTCIGTQFPVPKACLCHPPCHVHAGVEDSGWPRGLALQELQGSLATLRAMAAEVAASAQLLQQSPGASPGRFCACARVTRLCADHVHYTDMRIAGGCHAVIGILVGCA